MSAQDYGTTLYIQCYDTKRAYKIGQLMEHLGCKKLYKEREVLEQRHDLHPVMLKCPVLQ